MLTPKVTPIRTTRRPDGNLWIVPVDPWSHDPDRTTRNHRGSVAPPKGD